MGQREVIVSIARRYLESVKASGFPIQIEKAYIFGSFAKGCHHKESDIDIALVVKNCVVDYFDAVPPIWRLRENIDFRIEPHIIVPDEDYADFSARNPKNWYRNIKYFVILIHPNSRKRHSRSQPKKGCAASQVAAVVMVNSVSNGGAEIC